VPSDTLPSSELEAKSSLAFGELAEIVLQASEPHPPVRVRTLAETQALGYSVNDRILPLRKARGRGLWWRSSILDILSYLDLSDAEVVWRIFHPR
jgi:hypothetical protein